MDSEDPSLSEFGLKYEVEPAITKHIAYFLRSSRKNVESNPKLMERLKACLSESTLRNEHLILPTKVLFNGGVLKSHSLRSRILTNLARWNENNEPVSLEGADLDLAVAKGACYFGKLKTAKEKLRIRAGTNQSFYLGIAPRRLAVPNRKVGLNGLCIVPQGTEEGSQLPAINRRFGLKTGNSKFRIFTSKTRSGDQVGALVEEAEKELQESAKLSVDLEPLEDSSSDSSTSSTTIPVEMKAYVSDVGTLQLYMKHVNSDKQWELEFDVRGT